jgi:hypothetical protein
MGERLGREGQALVHEPGRILALINAPWSKRERSGAPEASDDYQEKSAGSTTMVEVLEELKPLGRV